jgi:gliding motility-associated lipoprotein GldH
MKLGFVGCFLLMMFLSSCDKSAIIDENRKIENSMWDASKPLVFIAQITDTIAGHNVYINLRNSGTYSFSNIFLFMNTQFPNGQLDRDTLEIRLATPEGKWMGKGLGDVWDNRILFKKNVRFPQKGEYRFEITHAMRMNPLQGILDGGMRIERLLSTPLEKP